MKIYWKSLRRHFGRLKINSISVVEYKANGILVRALSQVLIKKVIIEENLKRFSLAYSSPLFDKKILE